MINNQKGCCAAGLLTSYPPPPLQALHSISQVSRETKTLAAVATLLKAARATAAAMNFMAPKFSEQSVQSKWKKKNREESMWLSKPQKMAPGNGTKGTKRRLIDVNVCSSQCQCRCQGSCIMSNSNEWKEWNALTMFE